MALRSFVAPDGSRWQVWEVSVAGAYATPRTRERRGQDLLLYRGPERRGGERRAPCPPSLLPRELAGGWLVFDCDGERRRLAPPPAEWEDLTEELLVGLWMRARRVASRTPPAGR